MEPPYGLTLQGSLRLSHRAFTYPLIRATAASGHRSPALALMLGGTVPATKPLGSCDLCPSALGFAPLPWSSSGRLRCDGFGRGPSAPYEEKKKMLVFGLVLILSTRRMPPVWALTEPYRFSVSASPQGFTTSSSVPLLGPTEAVTPPLPSLEHPRTEG